MMAKIDRISSGGTIPIITFCPGGIGCSAGGPPRQFLGELGAR